MSTTIIKLSNLANQVNAELQGNGNVIITNISSIQSAKKGSIVFIVNSKYRKQIIRCQASALVLTKKDLPFIGYDKNVLVVKDPYLTYAKIAKIFVKKENIKPVQGISSSATIDSSANLGNNISVGANTVIESDTILEDNVIIGAGCFIGKKSKIKANSLLWANVTIYHEVEIGKNCLIHSGSVIGSDGFGYANDCGKWIKIPQLGRVVVGDNVEIGACTTIDRGALDDTLINSGVIIDNQCQIAHNVIIGENTAIAGGVIVAGSSKIGRHCMIGGAAVINGHIEICDKVTITGMSMVIRTIKQPGIYSSGIPLQPNKIWRKTAVLTMNISNMNKRFKAIERKIYQKD